MQKIFEDESVLKEWCESNKRKIAVSEILKYVEMYRTSFEEEFVLGEISKLNKIKGIEEIHKSLTSWSAIERESDL